MYLAPSSVHANSQLRRPIGITRKARSKWLVSLGRKPLASNYLSIHFGFEEALDDRPGLFLAPRALGLPHQIFIANLRLDRIQDADPIQRLVGIGICQRSR